MGRLTEKRQGKWVIPLRLDGKHQWFLCSAGMGDAPAKYLYGEYADRLAAYEDTGLEPDTVSKIRDIVLDISGDIDHLHELVQAEKDGQEVYRLALDTWGADAQTLIAFEEMSELQKELCKHARGKNNREEIAEEIADVLIMLDQMMLLHDCKQTVKEWKQRKLKRLADRLTRYEAEAALEGGQHE